MRNKLHCSAVAVGFFFLVWGCSGEEKAPSKDKRPLPPQAQGEMRVEGYQSVAVRDGGTIAGKVVFNGQWKSVSIAVSKDPQACGKTQRDPSMILDAQGGVQGAVVRITNIHKGKEMGPVHPVLDQKGCRYEPHVLAFPVGTSLEILNSDGILHNVHSFSEKNSPFNKAQPKFRKKITQTFTEAELISLKCDVHNWMSAWLFVSDHPYYSVTSSNGTFELADVPPGAYTLEVWQEKLGRQTKGVVVKPHGKIEVDFEFSQSAS